MGCEVDKQGQKIQQRKVKNRERNANDNGGDGECLRDGQQGGM